MAGGKTLLLLAQTSRFCAACNSKHRRMYTLTYPCLLFSSKPRLYCPLTTFHPCSAQSVSGNANTSEHEQARFGSEPSDKRQEIHRHGMAGICACTAGRAPGNPGRCSDPAKPYKRGPAGPEPSQPRPLRRNPKPLYVLHPLKKRRAGGRRRVQSGRIAPGRRVLTDPRDQTRGRRNS